MLNTILQNLYKVFTWWVVITPWEKALRVRAGRHVKKLDAGIYLKIPFVDKVFKKSTRRRISVIRPQTLTTRDGHTITLCGALGYAITDLEKLFNTLDTPEDTLEAEVSTKVAEFVVQRDLVNCGPEQIENHVRNAIDLRQYGLEGQEFYLTSFAKVRTYRIITGEMPVWNRSGNLDMSEHEDRNPY